MNIRKVAILLIAVATVTSCATNTIGDEDAVAVARMSKASDVCMQPIIEDTRNLEIGRSFIRNIPLLIIKWLLPEAGASLDKELEAAGLKVLQKAPWEQDMKIAQACISQSQSMSRVQIDNFILKNFMDWIRKNPSECKMEITFDGLEKENGASILKGRIVRNQKGEYENESGNNFSVYYDDKKKPNLSLSTVTVTGSKCGLINGFTSVVLLAQPKGSMTWYVTSGIKSQDDFPANPDGSFELSFQDASIGLNKPEGVKRKWTFMALVLPNITAQTLALEAGKNLNSREMAALGYTPDRKSATLIDETVVSQ